MIVILLHSCDAARRSGDSRKKSRDRNPWAARAHQQIVRVSPQTPGKGGQGVLRRFVISVFVLVVLALGALEVVASHSVRVSEPMKSAAVLPTWCWR